MINRASHQLPATTSTASTDEIGLPLANARCIPQPGSSIVKPDLKLHHCKMLLNCQVQRRTG